MKCEEIEMINVEERDAIVVLETLLVGDIKDIVHGMTWTTFMVKMLQ